MNLKALFATFVCLWASANIYCQLEKGSKLPEALTQGGNALPANTYALVIGISQYEHFPSLNFADKDAVAFSEFLQSKAGGGIDTSHIFLRTNNLAKAGDIWRGFSWLERRADSVGKTAYIYFSGHGDAASQEEAYLLAHDAPNEGDPNLYNTGGTFQIYNLKSKIKKMVAKGVNVILITDACRTNELPGKENGNRWTFQSIMEQRSGELQMTSCASNEQSLEDKRWGGGRGVFSYYLIAGLSGLADNDPEDGEITLYELQRYIKDNVRKETKSLTTGKARQNPLFCCEEKNETVLSKVDGAWKQQMLAYMQQSSQQQMVAAVKSNAKGSSDWADSSLRKLYASFGKCLQEKKLIGSGIHAGNYLDSLLNSNLSTKLKEDLSDEYISALINEGQQTINRYTKPPAKDTGRNPINQEFFHNGSLYFAKAASYSEKNTDLWQELKSNEFYLEARAYAEETKPELLGRGVELARKSLQLHLMGYNLHTLGLLYRRMNQFDSAYKYYYKAYEKSPDWIPVIAGLRALFKNSGKFYNTDSAQKYLRILAERKQDPYSFWELGSALFNTHMKDSGLYYMKKASYLSRFEFNYLNQLLSAYRMNKNETAILNLAKELQRTDRNKFIQKEAAIGRCFNYLAFWDPAKRSPYLDSCIYWYKKSIKLDPGARIHRNLVELFHEAGIYDSMYTYALQYYKVDTTDLQAAGFFISMVSDQFSHSNDSNLIFSIRPFLQNIKKRLELNPEAKELHLAIADLYALYNQPDAALIHLKAGYNKNNFGIPLKKIASIYLNYQQKDSAIHYLNILENWARFYSNPIIVYNELNTFYLFEMKDYDQAIRVGLEGLKYALGLHGIGENAKVNEKGDLLQKIAVAYHWKGKADSVQFYLNELKKDTAAYHINMAYHFYNTQQPDSSLSHAETYVKQYEANTVQNQYLESRFYQNMLYHIAYLYSTKNNATLTLQYFKKAVMHDPVNSLSLFVRAKAKNEYSLDQLCQTKEFHELDAFVKNKHVNSH